jgi:enterobactin synthetase component D
MFGETKYGVWAAVEIPQEEPDGQQLVSAEMAYAQTLAPLRRRTWIAGRLALRQALVKREINHPEPILPNDRGAPQLQGPWTASISHKKELAIALVADKACGPIGIDIEIPVAVSAAFGRKILTPKEQADIASMPHPSQQILRYFSAKEAIYKALDPYVRRYVGFQEVELSTAFEARFTGPYAIEVTTTFQCFFGQEVLVSLARVQARLI